MKKAKKIIALLAVFSLAFTPMTVFADDIHRDIVIHSGSTVAVSGEDDSDADLNIRIDSGSTVAQSGEGDSDADLDRRIESGATVAQSGEGDSDVELDVRIESGSTVATSTQHDVDEAGAAAALRTLKVTPVSFVGTNAQILGQIPSIDGATALNTRILTHVTRIAQGEALVEVDAIPVVEGSLPLTGLGGFDVRNFGVSFSDPVDVGRYASITISISYPDNSLVMVADRVTLTYYIDKTDMTQTTKAVFDAYVEALKAVEEEEEEEEWEEGYNYPAEVDGVTFFPLTFALRDLGLEFHWDDELQAVVVEDVVSFNLGINEFTILATGQVVQLEAAAYLNQEYGRTYVPASFFYTFFGLDVMFDGENYVLTPVEVQLVQLRRVADMLGLELGWDDETKSVTVALEDFVVAFTIGSDSYVANGETHRVEGGVPVLIDDFTHVPSAFFTYFFGTQFIFDGDDFVIVNQ